VNGVGGFAAVTTTSTNGVILANDTQSRADDENTTERLSYAGAGSWQVGKYDDGQTQLGTTSFKCDDEYTEVEFAIQIDSTYASDADDFEFRVEQTDGTDFDFYPGSYPTATASIAAADPAPEVSDDVTLVDTPAVTPLVLPNLSEADGITLADTLVDIEVTGGVEPDRNIPGATDDVTIGESVTMAISDMVIDTSDGLTVGEDVTVSDPFEPMIPIDLGVDNMSVWRQGVVIYDG
jgi:hypothetical protein